DSFRSMKSMSQSGGAASQAARIGPPAAAIPACALNASMYAFTQRGENVMSSSENRSSSPVATRAPACRALCAPSLSSRTYRTAGPPPLPWISCTTWAVSSLRALSTTTTSKLWVWSSSATTLRRLRASDPARLWVGMITDSRTPESDLDPFQVFDERQELAVTVGPGRVHEAR